jgi:hypothetical protein
MTKGSNSTPAPIQDFAPPPYESLHNPTHCPGSIDNRGSSQVAAQCGQHQIDAHHHANTSLSGGSGNNPITLPQMPSNCGVPQISPTANNRQQYIGASINHAHAVNVRSATGNAPYPNDISQPGGESGESVQNGGKRKTAKRKTVKRHNRSLSKKRPSKTKRRSTSKRHRSSKKTKKTQRRKGILNRRSKRKNNKRNVKKVYFNI